MRANGVDSVVPSATTFDATNRAGTMPAMATTIRASIAATTSGHVHRRCTRDGRARPDRSAASAFVSTRPCRSPSGASLGGSVDVRVSVTLALSVDGLTIRAAFIAGLAIVALLFTGWRQPARAESRSPRGPLRREAPVVPVEHFDTPTYKRSGIVRRLLALAASGGIAILTGVLIAIITSFVIALAVIWMTNLLVG